MSGTYEFHNKGPAHFLLFLQQSTDAFIDLVLPNVTTEAGRAVYEEMPEFGTKVVRILINKVCPSEVRREVLLGLRDIRYLQLVYDVIDLTEAGPVQGRGYRIELPIKSKIPMIEALTILQNLMAKGGYAYRNGFMYSLPKEAM